MQFSFAKLFTVALLAVSTVEAQTGNGGKGKRGRGRGRYRGKGKTTCLTGTRAPVAGQPTTFQTSTVDATTTLTTQSPSSTPPTVVVVTSTVNPEPEPTTTAAPPAADPTTTTPTPEPTTSTTPAPAGLTEDETKALDSHNAARSEVGLSALTWSDSLAAEAQAYAQQLVSIGELQHAEDRNGHGENLYWQSGDGTPLINGANAWVSEKSVYSGQAIGTGDFGAYGHYTQIVWRDTTEVGIAGAPDGKGGVYVVARYNPAGNFVGQTPYKH